LLVTLRVRAAGVALCHPCAESVNDRQADDEKANAYEDLKAAFLGLKANVPAVARTSTRENVYRPYISQ
jgi:hypothetical protein